MEILKSVNIILHPYLHIGYVNTVLIVKAER